MSVRYEPVRLLLRLAVALATAVALAALWALARGGGYRHSLALGCYAIAGLVLLVAVAGGSPSRSGAASAGWREKWAYSDTFATNQANPPDGTLGPAIVFGVVSVLMFLIGWVIS